MVSPSFLVSHSYNTTCTCQARPCLCSSMKEKRKQGLQRFYLNYRPSHESQSRTQNNTCHHLHGLPSPWPAISIACHLHGLLVYFLDASLELPILEHKHRTLLKTQLHSLGRGMGDEDRGSARPWSLASSPCSHSILRLCMAITLPFVSPSVPGSEDARASEVSG